MLAAFGAIPAAFLPYRWWSRFPSLQIERFALLSALITILLGFFLGIVGFFAFYETGIGRQVGALGPIVFALATPQGVVATYLILSGMFRAATAYAEDWHGDPILTAIVTATTSSTARRRDTAARAERLHREGADVPDRLYSGEWAGLPQVELVVVACRRKNDWETGVVVLTADKSYRLGAPFDQNTPAGLRTIYPLTPLEPGAVIRRSVVYELPPFRER